ncbi:hypothetical protein [Dehalogenimonas formicexedens]|uniref:PAP2 superfamily protein n=2 Tax=Dehalogenimonas TaxID=670486 RepID=A0A1P8F9G1_9CHLR|nr:hypothetical protein [Dehalogenimonas formicexedens]APV45083.1 hypothetical protein Dform_01764 [Dehalogenimonas formicexedens]
MASAKIKTGEIAKIVSQVLHPYVILVPVVVLLAVSFSREDWVKWSVIALLPAYLFPLLYMQARVVLVARTTGVKVTHRSLFRERSREMIFLICLFGLPSALILFSLDAPPSIMATLIGLSATALLITFINLRYRASFHLSLFTSVVTSIAIVFGPPALVVAVLIPVLGISRYQLGEHTPLQLVTGFVIGLVVTAAVFQGFNLL